MAARLPAHSRSNWTGPACIVCRVVRARVNPRSCVPCSCCRGTRSTLRCTMGSWLVTCRGLGSWRRLLRGSGRVGTLAGQVKSALEVKARELEVMACQESGHATGLEEQAADVDVTRPCDSEALL